MWSFSLVNVIHFGGSWATAFRSITAEDGRPDLIGIPPAPTYTTVFDRPFAFAIAKKASGTLLFFGEVQDPQ